MNKAIKKAIAEPVHNGNHSINEKKIIDIIPLIGSVTPASLPLVEISIIIIKPVVMTRLNIIPAWVVVTPKLVDAFSNQLCQIIFTTL